MGKNIVPVSDKFLLTVSEASEYYHIGENKLRRLSYDNPQLDFWIMNGNRLLIKKEKFEDYLNELSCI